MPIPTIQVIEACGETRSLPVYNLSSEFLELALDELRRNDTRKFALHIGPGTARFSKTLSFLAEDKAGVDVTLMGTHSPDGLQRTKIDLGQHAWCLWHAWHAWPNLLWTS